MMSDCDTVQVAVRVRPLVKNEIEKGCRSCLDTIPNEPQVTIRSSGQSYTFNFVYNEHDDQSTVYDSTVQKLVQNLFKGYNVTILAYGQTGSGKTYSMGTNYTSGSDMGIIPRSVVDIFRHVDADDEWEFKITASFIELYKEHLFDLLSSKPREQCNLDIREDANRGIYMPGLIERRVCSADDTLRCLQEGVYGISM